MKNLNDNELLSQLKILVQDERKLTIEILHYLREIEKRRLYALRAYSSLHEMCVKELGYSSGAAWRRIESMRLLRDVPMAEEKILSGELNLSVLAQVQTYVKQEKKEGKVVSSESKAELLQGFCGKSVREVQKTLLTLSPKLAQKFQEVIQPISEQENALKIIADQELMGLLEQVRNLSGIPGEDLAALIKKMTRTYIAKKTAPAPRRGTARQGIEQQVRPVDGHGARRVVNCRDSVSPVDCSGAGCGGKGEAGSAPERQARFVPKATKVLVRSRAENRCEHADAQKMRGTNWASAGSSPAICTWRE